MVNPGQEADVTEMKGLVSSPLSSGIKIITKRLFKIKKAVYSIQSHMYKYIL